MTLAQLESQIRDRINRGRVQSQLIERLSDWHRLCSALDVIGDTELAIDSYLSLEESADIGLCYLYIYGALQLLQTQQDAVEHVCKALRITPKTTPKVVHVREIRSDSVAHPTFRKEDRKSKSSFIVRMSLGHRGYTLMTLYSDEPLHRQKLISIPVLIDEQRAILTATLQEVIDKMDTTENEHRDKHKNEKLQDCFPPTLRYFFSKIFEAITSDSHFPIGGMHVELVEECITKLKDMMVRREEWGVYDSVNYEYELLEYPIAQLKLYFSSPETSSLNAKDAVIFMEFIDSHIHQIKDIAIEIDENYGKDAADHG